MVHQKKPQRMLRLFCCTIPFGTDSHFAQALVFVSRGLVAKNGCGFVKQGPRLSVSESGERKRGAKAGSEQCTPRAAYNRTSGFAKQNGGLTGRQANRTEFLTRPLMVHQSTRCKKLQRVFYCNLSKKVQSGAPSGDENSSGPPPVRRAKTPSGAFLERGRVPDGAPESALLQSRALFLC